MAFLGFGGGEERAVRRALERMEREMLPIRVEVERYGFRFKSYVMLRKDLVAVAKPRGWTGTFPPGTILRFRTAERKPRELRLEVVSQEFRAPTGQRFVLCNAPSGFAPASPRASERIPTQRIRNLVLALPELGSAYRLQNISLTGCRIDTGEEDLGTIWTVGDPVSPAELRVGQNVSIALDAVVPRAIAKGIVGLEFQVARGSPASAHLGKLIHWLEHWEDKQSRVLKQG